MNEEILKQTLKEMSEELKNLSQDQAMTTTAIESFKNRLDEFDGKIESINIEPPKLDLTGLNKAIGNLVSDIRTTMGNVTVQIDQKLNPPKEERVTFKFSGIKKIKAITIIVLLAILIVTLKLQWHNINEGERYKYSYHWLYNQNGEKVKKVLYDTFQDFQNDSIYNLRKDSISLTFEK